VPPVHLKYLMAEALEGLVDALDTLRIKGPLRSP
jgi:hypothetical protein